MLDYVLTKYNVDINQRMPVELPGKRQDLAVLFRELGYEKGVEMGVEQGKFSQVICESNPGVKLYSIDAWTAYDGYREHVSQEKLDDFHANTIELLSPYNCEVIKGFSLKVVNRFADNSLDFVYIDGNHEFLQVTQDISAWEKKVRKGGILAGHDYKRVKGDFGKDHFHVKDVVQAWTYSHRIVPWFIFKDEQSPSWFWIK